MIENVLDVDLVICDHFIHVFFLLNFDLVVHLLILSLDFSLEHFVQVVDDWVWNALHLENLIVKVIDFSEDLVDFIF